MCFQFSDQSYLGRVAKRTRTWVGWENALVLGSGGGNGWRNAFVLGSGGGNGWRNAFVLGSGDEIGDSLFRRHVSNTFGTAGV